VPVPPTPADAESIKLATGIFKQLIEINTSHSVGSTTVAAEAMAKRLRDAGFRMRPEFGVQRRMQPLVVISDLQKSS